MFLLQNIVCTDTETCIFCSTILKDDEEDRLFSELSLCEYQMSNVSLLEKTLQMIFLRKST